MSPTSDSDYSSLNSIVRGIGLAGANTYADIVPVVRGLLWPIDLVRGRQIRMFEADFARITGGGRAFSFAAGRVALSAILDALRIGKGDEVILPGYTCVAVPNPVLFCGARPVYADIKRETLNIDPKSVQSCLSPRTRAIVVQHTFGLPAEMTTLMEIAARERISVIEDCTHALGAQYRGQLVGTFGDASFFSFEQSKIVSSGAGGVALSTNPSVVHKIENYQQICYWPTRAEAFRMLGHILSLIVFGGTYRSRYFRYGDYYLRRLGLVAGPKTTIDELNCRAPPRFAMRMANAIARIGRGQIGKLRWNIMQRRYIASIYRDGLKAMGVQSVQVDDGVDPVFVRYPFVTPYKAELMTFMKKRGISLGSWFTSPVHPDGVPLDRAQYTVGSCPNAEWAVRDVANLPVHPRMSEDDVRRVLDALLEYHRCC